MKHNKIFKYTLDITDVQQVKMPVGSQVISAKEQNGQLKIWAIIDTRCSEADKEIRIVGTGHEIDFLIGDYHFVFVDTVVMSNGLVWHVFTNRI